MVKLTSKIIPFMAAIVLFASCSSSRKAALAADREDIKGTWTLNKISYDGIASGETLKITLLDEGDENCLTGSTWVLPNNGYGSYTLTGNSGGCIAGERKIVWSYQKAGDLVYLQYKILPGGVKAKEIKDGYRLKITSSSKDNFVAQTETAFEGKSIFINYSFIKK